MCHAYEEEKLEGGDSRVVLRLPAALAPVKLAIFPLVKKDGLPEKAHEIMNELRFHFKCAYEERILSVSVIVVTMPSVHLSASL